MKDEGLESQLLNRCSKEEAAVGRNERKFGCEHYSRIEKTILRTMNMNAKNYGGGKARVNMEEYQFFPDGWGNPGQE